MQSLPLLLKWSADVDRVTAPLRVNPEEFDEREEEDMDVEEVGEKTMLATPLLQEVRNE